MPYVGLEHIEPQTMKLLGHGYAREVRSSSMCFSKNDVLYAKMRPYLNKVWVAEFDGICSTEFLVFSTHITLDTQFLALRLNAADFVIFANGQVSGERPRVDFEKLSRFSMFLPPLAEQQRIVAKLSAALSAVGASGNSCASCPRTASPLPRCRPARCRDRRAQPSLARSPAQKQEGKHRRRRSSVTAASVSPARSLGRSQTEACPRKNSSSDRR